MHPLIYKDNLKRPINLIGMFNLIQESICKYWNPHLCVYISKLVHNISPYEFLAAGKVRADLDKEPETRGMEAPHPPVGT